MIIEKICKEIEGATLQLIPCGECFVTLEDWEASKDVPVYCRANTASQNGQAMNLSSGEIRNFDLCCPVIPVDVMLTVRMRYKTARYVRGSQPVPGGSYHDESITERENWNGCETETKA